MAMLMLIVSADRGGRNDDGERSGIDPFDVLARERTPIRVWRLYSEAEKAQAAHQQDREHTAARNR